MTAQAHIRFGLGAAPGDRADADPCGALKAQLAGPDPGLASGNFAGLPSGLDVVNLLLAQNPEARVLKHQGLPLTMLHSQFYQRYGADGDAQIGWAISTDAGFRERLVWFWANHFSISGDQNQCMIFVGAMIREAIRPNVTGNFTDLVLAVERHPAMLHYLDNDNSVGPNSPAGLRRGRGLNENLGRECMELHTVGLAAGYSQQDVTNMAKILTGWSMAGTMAGGDATGFKFRRNAHEPGPQTVMGRSFDGGEQAGIDALTFLSTYPTTYQLIARKLVTHFVADNPPPAAVARIAAVLRDSGGALAEAYAALVDLRAAWIPGQKLKTPFEYMVSTLRAAPPPADVPHGFYESMLNRLGQPLWMAPLPNGWPDQAANWAGADAIMARIDFAFAYAGRYDQAGLQPGDIANAALGPLLRPATSYAIASAGSRQEALTLLFSSPEFQRR